MLHILFAAAQVWGSFVFFKMYKKQCAIIAKGQGEMSDVEAGRKTEEEVKGGEVVTATEMFSSQESEVAGNAARVL